GRSRPLSNDHRRGLGACVPWPVLGSELPGRRVSDRVLEDALLKVGVALKLVQPIGNWLDVPKWGRCDNERCGRRSEDSTLPSPRHFAAALPASFAAIDVATVTAPLLIASAWSCA